MNCKYKRETFFISIQSMVNKENGSRIHGKIRVFFYLKNQLTSLPSATVLLRGILKMSNTHVEKITSDTLFYALFFLS